MFLRFVGGLYLVVAAMSAIGVVIALRDYGNSELGLLAAWGCALSIVGSLFFCAVAVALDNLVEAVKRIGPPVP